MNHAKQIAVLLIAALVWTNSVVAAEQGFMQQVEAFGTGAEVKVELRTGKKLHGSIGVHSDDAFELRTGKSGNSQRVVYADLRALKITRIAYPDDTLRAGRASSAIRGFGVGSHLRVKVASGESWNGRILKVRGDTFSFVRDRKTDSITILYADVTELRPSPPPSNGPKPSTWKGFGIAMGVLTVLFAIGGRNGDLP